MFKWVESPLASALFRFTSWIFLCLAGLFAFVETPWFHRLEMRLAQRRFLSLSFRAFGPQKLMKIVSR